MITIQMMCSVGINPGYCHANEIMDRLTVVHTAWMEIARDLWGETGLFISVTATNGRTFYPEEWGCPKGGEDIVMLNSICNPEFVKDENLWRKTAIEACRRLGKVLKQATVYVLISDVDFHYIRQNTKPGETKE